MASRPTPTERPRPAEPTAPIGIPRVLAIVVTHNGRRWFKECIVGLNNQTYPAMDVLVVDDASLDTRSRPTLKRIAKRHLKRRHWGYVRTPRPLGFGGAINWALSRVKTDADLLLFIHDDAALDNDALEKMVGRIVADESAAVVGPKVVDWDDPSRLEEVGMAIDRLGYPYKGLEPNEIDLGQHDQSVEVFYVTSTCMLMRHDVFRDLRGWDARLRAFSEDLDLCWRARIQGHSVRVEPTARVRHAIALAKGERRSPFRPQRYYIRRNRLRTIAKNSAGLRLLALIPLFLVIAAVETVGFFTLRQFREIPNLFRAIVWNIVRAPQTLAERNRIQRTRRVPDRRLQRLTVRESTRIRAYTHHQAERIEEAWGRRADVFSRRLHDVRAVIGKLRGRWGFVAFLAVVAFLVAFRHLFWEPPASIGELLPFPDRATAMWRAFLSPWRGTGLGQSGAAPPAFVLLGIFPIIALGAAGAAQKLLVLALGGIAFFGAYRLVSGVGDRPSRFAAGAAYAFGAVGYAGIREGALGALVFGAAAPFVIGSIMRLTGWMRPPGWARGRSVARVALGSAVSAAFVPGSLVLYLLAAAVLAAARVAFEPGERAVRGFVTSGVGLVVGWVLLLPWSASWFSHGGVFSVLMTGATWHHFAASYADDGIISVLLGQTPNVPALFGLALPLLGLIAVVVGEGQRRRAALAMWALLLLDGWLITLIRAGWLRPLFASPTEAGVLAAVAFATLAGLAVAAFRLDLPRRGIGLIQATTLSALAVAAFLVVVGLGPKLLGGAWGPGLAAPENDPVLTAQLSDLLGTEAEQEGLFRVLWVGDRWSPTTPTAARPHFGHMITGPRGQQTTDLFERTETSAESELDNVIRAVEAGDTDIGGSLLGTFNVRYVVLDRGPGAYRWLAQRDLALVRAERKFMLLQNLNRVARAAVYPDVPPYLDAVAGRDPKLVAKGFPKVQTRVDVVASSKFVGDNVSGPGAAVLTEAHDDRWTASVGGEQLERIDAGWANGFDVPSGSSGTLVMKYPRSAIQTILLIVIALAWIAVIGGAFPRRRRQPSLEGPSHD